MANHGSHFFLINQSNDALALARDENPTDEASMRNIGEALFFRAYSYWELVKTYGEVPLINFPLNDPTRIHPNTIRPPTT